MDTSLQAPCSTFEIHHVPGMPFYVVERRHDGRDYPSTNTPLRCVAGPYLTNAEAAAKADRLEAAVVTEHGCDCGPGDCGHNVVGAS